MCVFIVGVSAQNNCHDAPVLPTSSVGVYQLETPSSELETADLTSMHYNNMNMHTTGGTGGMCVFIVGVSAPNDCNDAPANRKNTTAMPTAKRWTGPIIKRKICTSYINERKRGSPKQHRSLLLRTCTKL